MLPLKLRLKYFAKLAQAVPGAPASPTAPTSPNAPTEPVSTTAATISPPPAFQASGAWGWVRNVYNSNSVSLIDNLVNSLNQALHYASNGKFNWQTLRNNFNVDASAAGGEDAKNLLNLSKMVHKNYLNSGNAFLQKVTGNQVAVWNAELQGVLNSIQLNPTGPVALKMGNPKDSTLNILRDLARYNPLQPQQPR